MTLSEPTGSSRYRTGSDKLTSIPEALSRLADGALVAVGGVLHENRPVALQRYLARLGLHRLRYVSLSACGYDLDFLIASGVVSETFVPAVTLDQFGTAYSFARASNNGSVTAHVVDAASIMAGYFASAEGLPFHPVAALGGSDTVKENPLLLPISSPIDGKALHVARALVPDCVFIHAQWADRQGNARIDGSTAHAERLLARTGRRVIISCDELVTPDFFESEPRLTTIPGMYVDSVCLTPYGAYPTASPGLYPADVEHIRRYGHLARVAEVQPNELVRFIDHMVVGPKTQLEMLNRVHEYFGASGWLRTVGFA